MTHRIGVLLYPGFQLLDAAGPLGAFGIASRFSPGAYDLQCLALAPGPVSSSCGAAMVAEGAAGCGRLDTLLVVGGEGVGAACADGATVAFIRTQAAKGIRMASVCTGAFLLAQAGVLDGRRATTHWDSAARFARQFPKVRLEPDRIHTRDGPVWTSAGVTAGIDLALALIAEDLGEAVAQATAQQLVVYSRRLGGQSQFSALLQLEQSAGRFSALMTWAREHLDQPLTVEALAAQAAMSPRHFARAFTSEAGVTPAKAVERLRLEAARSRIEGTAEPIEAVAEAAGFANPEHMRRAFVRAFGQPPQALRRAARAASLPLVPPQIGPRLDDVEPLADRQPLDVLGLPAQPAVDRQARLGQT